MNPTYLPDGKNNTQTADDLKRIKGIGPGIEKRLMEGGVHTFAQLAALSAQEIYVLLSTVAGITAQRIEEQNWIGQARALAAPEGTSETAAVQLNSRQHYATFKVNLLLGDDNEVRRTQVVHVQSGHEHSWAGWEEQRLLAILSEQATLHPAAQRTNARTTTLRVQIVDLHIEAIEGLANRMRIHLHFSMTGAPLSASTVDASEYLVEILAVDWQSGRRHTLATRRAQWDRVSAEQALDFEADLPEKGTYQILGTVLLLDQNAFELQLGPLLNVV